MERESPSGRPVLEWIEGLQLYSSDEEKIGHIDEINPEFFIVSKGLLGRQKLYLPRTGNERTEDDRVYLAMTKQEIESRDWSEPLEGQSAGTAQAGYESAEPRTGEGSHEAAVAETNENATETARIPRYEERVETSKTAEQVGEVRIGKDVVEERADIDVPVTREDVQVRRRAVDRPGDDGDAAFQTGDTVRVPVVEEQVEVRKEPRVVEEIEVQKVARQDTQRVSEPVRKERFDVDEEGRARKDRA